VPTGHIMMAMSLDGFVARKDHGLDWLTKQQTSGEDHGFDAFQESVDVIVMGSGSFRTLLGFGEWAYTKPVVVLSRSMSEQDIPERLAGKVEVSKLSPEGVMREFAVRGHERTYVDGGAVIQSFFRAGLIGEMKVTIVPILLGEGIRIFDTAVRDIDLQLLSAKPFPSGLVDLTYKVGIASNA